jgi:hypothetical protein
VADAVNDLWAAMRVRKVDRSSCNLRLECVEMAGGHTRGGGFGCVLECGALRSASLSDLGDVAHDERCVTARWAFAAALICRARFSAVPRPQLPTQAKELECLVLQVHYDVRTKG